MKREELYIALTDIDEGFIEEAARDIERGRFRFQPVMLRYAALAACFVLVVTLPMMWVTTHVGMGGAAPSYSGAAMDVGGTEAAEAPSEAEEDYAAGAGAMDEKEESVKEEAKQALPWQSIEEASRVLILTSEGSEITLTDPNSLDSLRRELLDGSYQPGAEYSEGDWLYQLDWYGEQGDHPERTTILADGTLVYGGSCYLTEDGGQLVEMLLNICGE